MSDRLDVLKVKKDQLIRTYDQTHEDVLMLGSAFHFMAEKITTGYSNAGQYTNSDLEVIEKVRAVVEMFYGLKAYADYVDTKINYLEREIKTEKQRTKNDIKNTEHDTIGDSSNIN